MTSLLRLPLRVAGFAAGTSLRVAGAVAERVIGQFSGRDTTAYPTSPSRPPDASTGAGTAPPATSFRPSRPSGPPGTPPVPESGRAGSARQPTKGGRQSRTRARAARLRAEQRRAEETADSPGARVRVDEPWPGYDAMNAADIVDRLGAGDEAQKGVVLLYEQTHRKRKTVIEAAGG